MTDIAALGFSVDTQPLTRVNGELTAMIRNAGVADRTINSLAGNISRIGQAGVANANAAAGAFQRMAAGATNVSSQVAAAHNSIATAANASAAAVVTSTRAAAAAAAAQNAAAAAAIRAGTAHAGYAANLNASTSATARANTAFRIFNGTIDTSLISINRLISVAGALAAAMTVSAVAKAADSYTQLQNAMMLAGVTGSDLAEVQNRLFDSANRNGVPVDAMTTLYRRGSIAVKDLGKSQEDLLKVTATVAAALKIQGTGAEGARGALLQLAQSFGTGKVHAEEYTSLLENAYPLLIAAAKGMDGMDGSVVKLTNAVKAGQVSSLSFFEAIIKGGTETIEMADRMKMTLGQGWNVFMNRFTEVVGKIDEATGVSSKLVSMLVGVSQSFKDLSKDASALRTISAVFEGATGLAKDIWTAITTVGTAIGDVFGEKTQGTLQTFLNTLKTVGQGAKDAGDAIASGIRSANNVLNEYVLRNQKVIDVANQGWNLAVEGVNALGSALQKMAPHWDTIAVAAGAAMVVFAPAALAAAASGFVTLGAAGVAAFRAITVAMMANPFVALGVAIVGAIAAIYEFRDEIGQALGIDVMQTVKDTGNKMIAAFGTIWDEIKTTWSMFPDILEAAVIGGLNAIVRGMDMIKQAFASGVDWMSTKINKVNPFADIPMIGEVAPTKLLDNPAINRNADALEKLRQRAAERTKVDYLGDAYTGVKNALKPAPVPPSATPTSTYYGDDEGSGQISHLNDKGKATEITKANKGAESSYRKLIQSALNYIATENDKVDALNLSVEQARVLKHEQDLLNKAQMANLPITDALKAKISELASEMGRVDAVYASAQFMKEFKQNNDQLVRGYELESATLTMSKEAAMAYRIEQEALLAARQKGITLGPTEVQQIRDTAAATAAAAKKAEDYKFVMDTLRDAGKGAIEGILSALIRGTSVWDAFANAANRALNRIISKIADVAIDGIFDLAGGGSSSSGSGGSGGGIGNIFQSFLGSGSTSGGLSGILDSFSDKLSNMWSQTSSWLGMGDSMYNAGQAGSAFFGPTAQSSGIFGSGISGMGALSAGLGMFGGISSLMKGGTGNTISGIGQMIGAGVSLIPGIGQIAGPIISILSSVLPSLLGEDNKREHSYSNANLVYGSGGYYTNGSSQGNATSTASEQALSGAGAEIQKIFELLGGVKDSSKVWGLNLNSWTASGKNWSYTSNATSLIDPKTGQQEAWRMNMGNMMDTGSAQVAMRSILDGAMGEITDSMRTALTTLKNKPINQEAGLQDVANAVSFVKDIYDELGKPVLETKTALKALDTQFNEIRETAKELGLALEPVDDALEKARLEVAQGFLHDINAYFDPLGTGLADLAKAADQARLEIQYLIDQGLASAADLNKVENYYAEQETKMKEQLYGATLESLREVIESLKSGTLSGATAKTQYNAAYQSFFEDVQASLNGDLEASARVRDEAINLATMGQSQFGTASSQYQDLKTEIALALAQLEEKIGSTTGGTNSNGTNGTGYSNEYVQSLVMQLASSQNTIASQTQQINTLLSKMADLMDTMQRIASNQ